ncbi:sporulation protein [Bacillus sp. DJP31]|uniref:sporulation protein n=1 Tax=Bacillus sp. DJP31 TaxID=3409789 RepID=UPI003BB6DAFA
MDKTLAYLREIVSNYTDEHPLSKQVYKKLMATENHDELSFVRNLDEDEAHFLNAILPQEIQHALDEQDYTRMSELKHVYELII